MEPPLAAGHSQHEFPHFDGSSEIVPECARGVLAKTLYGGSLMRMVTRIFPLAAFVVGLGVTRLSAQQPGNGAFQWYIGGQGGVLSFKTSAQDRKEIPMGGGHVLITARRTGLLLSVEEAFGSDEVSVYTDGVGATQVVTFNDIRKYSAALLAFPLNMPIQPFVGVGLGIMHTVNPQGSIPGSTAPSELGSTGYGTFVGGVQFKISRFMGFGQYQITTSPSIQESSGFGADHGSGRLLEGPTHTLSAGLRIGLGGSRERPTSGGY